LVSVYNWSKLERPNTVVLAYCNVLFADSNTLRFWRVFW